MSDSDPPRSRHASKSQIAQAVDDGERQNGPILAEQTVGEDRAKDRESVNAHHEIMRIHVRLILIHRREHTRLIQNVVCHEYGQDRFHAVIREALGRFVTDDVRYARRHAREVWRRGEIVVFGHVVSFA